MSLREPVVVIIKVLTYGPKDVDVFWAVFAAVGYQSGSICGLISWK